MTPKTLQGKPQPKKNLKKMSVSYWKKRLWPLVSEYIRRRDTDENGTVRCVTCGRWKGWKYGDAGHFIEGRRNSIVYDPRNIHFQCKGCNGNLRDGNTSRNKEETARRYEVYMIKRYGQEVVDELRRKDKETKNWSIPELQELIKVYKEKLKALNDNG